MNKPRISVVVNTRNEEKNIADCLSALKFCDEIIVVDMESEDDTKKIAKQYTDKIFNHKNVGYVEPARNFAIKKAIGDWILIVDADERIPKTLGARLIEVASKNEADFVRIPRQNLIFGQCISHSRWWPDYNIRFFKKGSVQWQNEIHSVPITLGSGINLDPEIGLAITHFHYDSIDEYLTRAIRYSNQQAKELIKTGYKFDASDLITKPTSEFISRFFAGEGYKDGLHGLVLALLQMFSVLIVYLKVWQSEEHKPVKEASLTPIWQREFISKGKEFNFWFLTVLLSQTQSRSKKFFIKIKRKLSK